MRGAVHIAFWAPVPSGFRPGCSGLVLKNGSSESKSWIRSTSGKPIDALQDLKGLKVKGAKQLWRLGFVFLELTFPF